MELKILQESQTSSPSSEPIHVDSLMDFDG